ncbi:MAG: class B sortase [Clostridia bacterium]|nr:class B sortase [Clostridia bacterium]
MKKKILIIILFIAITAFGFSAYKLISSLNEYKKGEDTYSEISRNFVTVAEHYTLPQIITEAESTQVEELPLNVDFSALKEFNSDIVGWIYCPDTTINYPVLKAKDNDYYLRKMADRQYNIAGSIFMDYRNKDDLSDINTLIYGHNMKNSTMFSDIVNYSTDDPEYFNSHPYIYYFTEKQTFLLQVIGEKTVETSDRVFKDFENCDDLQDYLKSCTPKILFDKDYDLSNIKNLVSLSTCSKNTSAKRQIVFCVPVKIIN